MKGLCVCMKIIAQLISLIDRAILAARGFWLHQKPCQFDLLKCWFFSCYVNQWDCKLKFARPAYRNFTLFSGPVVTGQTGNDRHFLETLFEVCAWIVPRNTSTKTGSGTKYKWFSVHSHMAWGKLTKARFNSLICQGYDNTTTTLASEEGQSCHGLTGLSIWS